MTDQPTPGDLRQQIAEALWMPGLDLSDFQAQLVMDVLRRNRMIS